MLVRLYHHFCRELLRAFRYRLALCVAADRPELCYVSEPIGSFRAAHDAGAKASIRAARTRE